MENKPQGTCAFGHEKSGVFTVPYFSIRPSRRAVPRQSHGKIGDCEQSIKRGISGLFGIAFTPPLYCEVYISGEYCKKLKAVVFLAGTR